MARPEALSKIDSRSERRLRPTVSPALTPTSGGQARLHLTVLGVDRDDLRCAEILGAEDRAAEPRIVVEADVLGADAEREVGFAPVLATFGTATVAPLTRTSPAPFCSDERKCRKFIGGEPMKSATNIDAGTVVDLLRRAELLDHALVHDRDLVGHRHRFELIVGDVDRGRLDAVVQLAQLADHEVAELGIERAERLVHEEGHRPADDGAAERDALAVAAGESRHRLIQQMIDAQEPRGLLDPCGSPNGLTPWHFSEKPMFWRTFMCG